MEQVIRQMVQEAMAPVVELLERMRWVLEGLNQKSTKPAMRRKTAGIKTTKRKSAAERDHDVKPGDGVLYKLVVKAGRPASGRVVKVSADTVEIEDREGGHKVLPRGQVWAA